MRRLLTAWTPWWVLLAVVLAVLAAFAEGPIQNAWRPVIVVTAIVSMIVARRWNALPWLFVGLALVAAARMSLAETGSGAGFTADHMSWQQAISDVVVGASLVGVLVLTLRSRSGGTLGRRELLDGFTVAVGAGLATWLALANPGLDSGTNPLLAVGATAYFPAAIIVITFCADLLFDGLGRNRAMWFAFAGALANLAGAGIRALIQSDTIDESAHRLMLACFIAGFILFCAAISHPAAPEIFDPSTHPSDVLSRPHRETVLMAPLLLSLGVPLVLVAIVPPTSDTDLVVRTIATVTLVAAIVARLYVALDASASAQHALVRRLNRDELTNLLTRPRFVKLVSEVLEVTWRSEHHPTLIQVNIDRFKNINDTLGHDSANRLLVALAERLRTAAESFDGTVSRGGDDFVILDDSTWTRDDAEQRGERIKSVFAHPFTFGESVVFVTASIGVAMAPRNRTVSAEELMRRADIATHRAKADGRNRTVVFDDSMQSNLTHRMDVEHALHGVIGRQEMRLYYQPIVDIVTGHLSGFEALIRWRRGDGTILPPGDFIAIAEETGIINELGAWALNDALRQLRHWIEAGTVPTTTTISVNVSPRQIADPGFADVVRDALERTGISPHLLWLEMTESMMLDEPELAESTLRRIRSTGVRLALDDFGTGYSSLSLLQQFPIQRIKIDRAFVQGIADHSNDRSLVRTIIAMAQSMGLDLVAEGVETVHQLQSLRDLGCDKAQGYLISRPVPSDAMHTTMVALTELVDLSLFAVDQTRPGIEVPDRWLEHASAGPMNPLGRQLATRPIG